MSRITLITLIVCSICILGMGFGNVASAQCKSSMTVTEIVAPSGRYTACDNMVKHTFAGSVRENTGYGKIWCRLLTSTQEYARPFDPMDFPVCDTTITWYSSNPVSKLGNEIVIDVLTQGMQGPTRGWVNGTISYTVQYYASQQQ